MSVLKTFHVALAISLLAAVPVFAQSATTPSASSPSAATSQKTQGLPAGTTEQNYGQSWAQKQKTQGLPAGTTPQNYGSEWSSAHKQSTQSMAHGAGLAEDGIATKQK